MKCEEKIAETFLKTYFGQEPIYEPLGKSSPPDFCIDRTAFEVRRLNQNYVNVDGTAEALEKVAYPLSGAVSAELSKISFCPVSGSFFWGLDFERPIRGAVSKIAKELAGKAHLHYLSGNRAKQTITACGVAIELIPASNSYAKAFVSGYEADGDSGGQVAEIYLKGIQRALEEKITKTNNIVKTFRSHFKTLYKGVNLG